MPNSGNNAMPERNVDQWYLLLAILIGVISGVAVCYCSRYTVVLEQLNLEDFLEFVKMAIDVAIDIIRIYEQYLIVSEDGVLVVNLLEFIKMIIVVAIDILRGIAR
ncbi:unnamed protein product [Macrosiphum euphorbiae]|uniref:Transmembrane protein n=1 Tax=Macrosiphum euphorbiae TaxID=13131 RepID=A0AAV0VJV7_9HEMI|nr:unnamed protein product [Macrosiphum euphorbiae]